MPKTDSDPRIRRSVLATVNGGHTKYMPLLQEDLS